MNLLPFKGYLGFYSLLPALLLFSLWPGGDWYTVHSKEGNYTAAFPQAPVASTKNTETAIGPIAMNMYTYDPSSNPDDENLYYMISYSDYPDSISALHTDEGIKNFFRGAIDGAITNVKGSLISEEVINKKGFPGRKVSASLNDGAQIFRFNIFLVHDRVYMLLAITQADKKDNKSLTRFFDSFDLL